MPVLPAEPVAPGRGLEGATGGSSAKYAKGMMGGRTLQVTGHVAPGGAACNVLGDITNVPAPAHLAADTILDVGATFGSKCTPPPLCDEAESTGYGYPGEESCSEEEEDAFFESDFDDFPVVGTGSSCAPVGATPTAEPDFSEAIAAAGRALQMVPGSSRRSGRLTEEVQRAHRAEVAEGEEAVDVGVQPLPTERITDSGQRVPQLAGANAGTGFTSDVGTDMDWSVGPSVEAAVAGSAGPREAAGAGSGGSTERLREALRGIRESLGEEAGPGEDVGMAEVMSDEEDPQCVSEYVVDIYGRLEEDQVSVVRRQPDYMEAQPELTAHMRAVAIDWLVEVHVKFKLRTETLFLAVSLMDRFLATKRVRRRDLQLVVVCATFIAAKFEEIDPPEVRDFVFITKQACSKTAILRMEVTMLTALEFCLCRPTPAHYLERYQRANRDCEASCHFVQYILELALMDLKLNQYPPSQQVAAALLVSSRLLRRQPVWPVGMERRNEGSERAIRRCAREFCDLLEAADSNAFQAVRRKFLRPEYGGVASLDL